MEGPIFDLFNVDDMDDEEVAQFQPFLDGFFDEMGRSEMTSSSSSSSCPETPLSDKKPTEEHILVQARRGASLKTMMMCFILTITSEPDQRLDKMRIILMCQRNDFQKRRVYDVANILMVLGVLEHVSKGVYQWIGRAGYERVLEEMSSNPQCLNWQVDKQDVGTLVFITHITFSAMVSESVQRGLALPEFARVVANMAVDISDSLPRPRQWGPVAPRLLGTRSLHKTATRRIYDVLNGLEALGIVKRKNKHFIEWDVNKCLFPGLQEGSHVIVSDVQMNEQEDREDEEEEEGKRRKRKKTDKKRSRSDSKIKKVERVDTKSKVFKAIVARKRGKKNREKVDAELDIEDDGKDSTKDGQGLNVKTVTRMGTDFVKGIIAHAEYRMKFSDNEQDTAVDTFIVALMTDAEFSQFEHELTPNPRRDSELLKAKKAATLAYYRRRRLAFARGYRQSLKQPDPVMPSFVCSTQWMPLPTVQSLSDVEMKF